MKFFGIGPTERDQPGITRIHFPCNLDTLVTAYASPRKQSTLFFVLTLLHLRTQLHLGATEFRWLPILYYTVYTTIRVGAWDLSTIPCATSPLILTVTLPSDLLMH